MPGISIKTRGSGDGVAGIFRQPQESQQVLHVGRLDELETAVFVKGNVAAAQLQFEIEAVMGRAKQNGLMLERHARLAAIEDLPDDELRLLLLILAVDELGQQALFAGRP